MKKQQIAIVAKDINFEQIDKLIHKFDVPLLIVTPNYKEKGIKNTNIINDDLFLNRDEFFKKCKHSRPGWLYQQFLKYEIVIKSEFENTLIIDGDSLIEDKKFLKPHSLYYTPKNIEIFYSNFIAKILGEKYVTRKNYITNQMNFNRESLITMLKTAFGSLDKYPELIMDFIEENENSEFSEYQTYAAWDRHENKSKSEMIKVFRRLDLVNVEPNDSLKKYDLVAFEYGHRTDLLRTIRARILYSIGRSLG